MSWRASSGLRAWVVQRVSAVYLALCFIALAIALVAHRPLSFETWHGWFAHAAINVFAALFFVALVAHAWIGMRDVILDYVRNAAARFAALALIGLLLLAMLLWSLRVLWSLPLT
jgi:succinate dehydrogenase / fumarate reductase membrane anchor subunit